MGGSGEEGEKKNYLPMEEGGREKNALIAYPWGLELKPGTFCVLSLSQ